MPRPRPHGARRGVTKLCAFGPARAALLLVLLLGVAAACTRPLSPNERRFAADLLGPGLNADKVRVARGMGLAPLPDAPDRKQRLIPVKAPPREGLCDRDAPEAPSGPPPAWTMYNRIHVVREFYQPDLAAHWPQAAFLPGALILGHELVHVWQWQNRARTGYRPFRAALESFLTLDPYFYRPDEGDSLLSYGYEQQAALLEDYLCYALYDPANPRRDTLRAVLRPYFPLARLDAALGR